MSNPTEMPDASWTVLDTMMTLATVLVAPAVDQRVDVAVVLRELATRQINDVLIECGPTLAGQMLSTGLVDELVIYQAPHIMGSQTRGMFETPDRIRLDQRADLRVTDIRRIGDDIRITVRPDSD